MSDPLFARFGREYRAGDVLFREGESGAEMFVVQSGAVQISKTIAGESRPIATLGRGEFLGEMAILNDKPRTATATVVEDMRCLVIDARTLESMITKSPEIAMRLVKKLARRLDGADEMIQMLLNPDPQARVLMSLKRHVETFGVESDTGVRVQLRAIDLASEVGVSASGVADVLNRLKRMRIAEVDDGSGGIVVPEVARLLEFLEFLEMPKKFEAP